MLCRFALGLSSMVAFGCRSDTKTVSADESLAWTSLEALTLEPMAHLVDVPLQWAQTPSRLVALDRRGLTFVLDSDSVHLVDADYLHSAAIRCVSTSVYTDAEDGPSGAPQGDCGTGEVEIERGVWMPQVGPAAMAVDEEALRVWVVSVTGGIHQADADHLTDTPWDHLRLSKAVTMEGVKQVDGAAAVAVDDVIWTGVDGSVAGFNAKGDRVGEFSLEGALVDLALVDDQLWAVTTQGVFNVEEQTQSIAMSVGPDARAASDGAQGVWVSFPETGEVMHLPDQEVISVDATGPLAVESESGRVWVATVDGVVVIDGDDQNQVHQTDGIDDLHVTSSGEILILRQGQVEVFLDEESVLVGNPLQLTVQTFLEQPRDDEIECGEVKEALAFAEANRVFLNDLPLELALGVVPAVLANFAECDLVERAAENWDADRTELGVLFHDEPWDCVGDDACYTSAVNDMMADFEALRDDGTSITWFSGIQSHTDLGFDWVAQSKAHDLPQTMLFFGMGVLPEVAFLNDARTKNVYPIELSDVSAAWTVGSAGTTSEHTEGASLAIYPGDSVALFNRSSCPNLYVRECHVMNLGDQSVDSADFVVARLGLHRALAARSNGQSDHWGFHLPDLMSWDYTVSCEREDGGLWTGANCQAEMLQEWIHWVHQAWVLNGAAEWTAVSSLERP